jgi:hypothetical protein
VLTDIARRLHFILAARLMGIAGISLNVISVIPNLLSTCLAILTISCKGFFYFYFYSLTTGRRLNRNHWTDLPMPAEVIERVHQLADQGKAPDGLAFADRTGIDPHAGDDKDDADYDPDLEGDDDDVSLIADDIAGVTGETENKTENENEDDNEDENESENEENFQNENENENLQNEDEDDKDFTTDDEVDDEIDDHVDDQVVKTTLDETEAENEDESVTKERNKDHADAATETGNDTVAIMNQKYGPRDTNHHLRPKKPRDPTAACMRPSRGSQ